MSAKPNFFRLGLFIVGGVALLIAILLIFGGGQLFHPKVMMETYVDGSVQGIDVGSPVKFRGVPIGKVTQISFTFTEYGIDRIYQFSNYVVVFMEIDREVFPNMFTKDLSPLLEKNIEQGLRVRIQPQGITGLNYMDIDYLDPERFPILKPSWKPRYYYIPSAPGQLASFIDSINGILREVEQLNINGISQSATVLLKNLNQAVKNAEIEKISANVQHLVKNLDSTLEAAAIPELSADARALITNLDTSNKELQQILKNLEPASRISAVQVHELLRNLASTSENLEQLSAELKKRPSLLLWGSPSKKRR